YLELRIKIFKNIVLARMFSDVLLSFRRFCLQSKALPPDLHIKLSDIIQKAAKHTDLFPYFLRHAHELFPHLHCMEDLKHISDLTEPSYWYIEARDVKRQIIYHAGPTNSGKTYSALKRFQESSSGIYCGPLKLLANEVFIKTNNAGHKCDLVTGEERKFGDESGNPSEHMACTVEMVNLEKNYEVAVIDEIQMIKDQQRGWAWTRALLGIKAQEIHVCGDLSATDLISDLSFLTGDDFELKTYERLTSLTVMDKSFESYDNVQPGDCFVCFNKNDIYNVLNNLEVRGHEVAVIYGSMPPGVKLAQAARFNDPDDRCKILVATDAIGMGLNLNIRRIIFYSLRKVQQKENKHDADGKDASEIENITTSQALQIAGRAGRFNTAFKDGFVTTFSAQDLPVLKEILNQPLEKTSRAGLHPTAEQIELFAYHLPNHSLSDLIKIFMSICRIDSGQYFLCNFGEIAFLAEMIDHIPINLRSKYTFATSPINRKQTFVCSCFVKFVRFYSNNEVVTDEILKKMIEWPFKIPQNINEVAHLETVYDVLDLYLWLAYRFPDIFTYIDQVKQMRVELEQIIYEGVKNISVLNQSGNKTRHLINRRHKRVEAENLSQINNMFSSHKNVTPQCSNLKMEKIDFDSITKNQVISDDQKYNFKI
ncbi:ATP-dependent RNA helicase mitochondrial, partial [Brachionus plicatilis]